VSRFRCARQSMGACFFMRQGTKSKHCARWPCSVLCIVDAGTHTPTPRFTKEKKPLRYWVLYSTAESNGKGSDIK
jgi:hypothetical protein